MAVSVVEASPVAIVVSVVVAVVLENSNGLGTVAVSVMNRPVSVVRMGRGPRVGTMLGFKNGFGIVFELLSLFSSEAVRSPGSRSDGSLFPIESVFREVLVEFVFEANMPVEFVEANVFASVEEAAEDVHVSFSLLRGTKRPKWAGELLFGIFWSREIRRRTCFGMKRSDKTTSIDSCGCSPPTMVLVEET